MHQEWEIWEGSDGPFLIRANDPQKEALTLPPSYLAKTFQSASPREARKIFEQYEASRLWSARPETDHGRAKKKDRMKDFREVLQEFLTAQVKFSLFVDSDFIEYAKTAILDLDREDVNELIDIMIELDNLQERLRNFERLLNK